METHRSQPLQLGSRKPEDIPWRGKRRQRGETRGWSGVDTREADRRKSAPTAHAIRIGDDRDRPNLAPGASNNPVLGGPDQYFDPTAFEFPEAGFYGNLGRNTLIGPGFANFDFSVFKNTAEPAISEQFQIQFRVEFFNLFNRVNFGEVSERLFTSRGGRRGSAGRISSTTTTSRQIQMGLKILF